MQRFSAHFLISALVLTACPASSGTTTDESTSDASSGGSTSSGSADTGSTTDTPTTTPTTTPTNPTTNPTTETSEPTTDPTTATTTGESTTGGSAVCGDGAIEGGEACDDSNLMTEISTSKTSPLKYDATSCIDDCSLVLGLCGNGDVDPGEACDDGNQDSYDDCTTSCTVNDKDYHAPCQRMCTKECDTDVSSGTFTGCENMEVPAGGAAVCYVSTKFQFAPRHFAEGECAVTAQTCDGGLCPPDIGDYDALKDCPTGTTLVDRMTEALGVKVKTKVCQKICESDAECRWNAFDKIWGGSGQFRCQTTADSKGVKICADAQN